MKIRWFGHACFYITSDNNIKILTDPFDETVGYSLPDVEADIVSTSHDHYDHNNIDIVKGAPMLVRGSGKINIKGIDITGVATFHDDSDGQKRGRNTVFKFNVDGLNVCHLGDLGHIPTHDQVREIGRVDILLAPVGGTYTVDHVGTVEIINLLKPQITIPMHYKTDALKFSILGVEEFLSSVGNYKKVKGPEVEIGKDSIGDYPHVIVLDYK